MSQHANDEPAVPLEAELVDERVSVLRLNWESIQENRNKISKELARLAKNASGVNRARIEHLSDWFGKPQSYGDALPRQDVLSVCLPLCNGDAGEISKNDIASSCRLAACWVGRDVSASRKILRALIYPVLVLIGAALLAVGFSYLIAPEFQTMFEEFGIQLPMLTIWVLDSAKVVRQWSWVLGLWLIGGILVSWVFNRAIRRNRPGELNWLDSQFLTSRDALASWSWHLSLLLEAGIPQNEAVKSAGKAASKAWLRKLSKNWATQNSLPPSAQAAFFKSKKYRLLDYALQVPMSSGKVALLRETAGYYWDRNRHVAEFWTQWLVSFMLIMIGASIFLLIISLFMPLIAIVSGLTGGK